MLVVQCDSVLSKLVIKRRPIATLATRRLVQLFDIPKADQCILDGLSSCCKFRQWQQLFDQSIRNGWQGLLRVQRSEFNQLHLSLERRVESRLWRKVLPSWKNKYISVK